MDARPQKPEVMSNATSRRSFFRETGRAVVGTGLGLGLFGGFLALRKSSAEPAGMRGRWGVVRPPGAGSEPDFLALCLRCTRCADACDTQCIRFFGAEAGELQGTPYILTGQTACNMCLACTTACPTDALQPLTEKTAVRMGTAVVDERLCVSFINTGVCGACHTICPLRNRAITLDHRNQPTVHPEQCTGCGLCEEICIVRDRRAIYIQTNRQYGTPSDGVHS